MEVIFSWIILSLIIGFIGSNRKVGFFGALLWSLLLSPIIGLIITLTSESINSIRMREKSIRLQEEQKEILNNINNRPVDTISELSKLNELKTSGAIDEIEFQTLKKKLLDEKNISSNFKTEVELKAIEDKYKSGLLTPREYEISKSNILNVSNEEDNININTWIYIAIFICVFIFLYLMI